MSDDRPAIRADAGVADAFTRMHVLLHELEFGTPSSFSDGLAPLPVSSNKTDDVAQWATLLAGEALATPRAHVCHCPQPMATHQTDAHWWLTPFTRWLLVANYAATGRWPETYELLAAAWPLDGTAPLFTAHGNGTGTRAEGPVVPPPVDLVDEANAARRIALKIGQIPDPPRAR
jgi:hypothetical protein